MAKYKVVKGGNLALQATAHNGYQFVEWQWNGEKIDKGTEIEGVSQVDVQENVLYLNGVNSQVGTDENSIQAIFTAVEPPVENVDVYADPNPSEGGDIEQLNN